MDEEGRCSQATDVDAAVWQALAAATVAPGTAAVGVRTDDAAPQGGLSGRRRRVPLPGAPPRQRGSGGAQRVIACSGGGCSICAGGWRRSVVGSA
jgi:hypothetical protein